MSSPHSNSNGNATVRRGYGRKWAEAQLRFERSKRPVKYNQRDRYTPREFAKLKGLDKHGG